jgi:transposase
MQTSVFSHFVGIDVSFHKLDVAWGEGPGWVDRQVPNTWADTQAFAADLSARMPNCCCIVEHTGTYSSKIALALCQAGLKVSLISPMQSKAFATMRHRTTKNDRADARLLAQYGAANAAELQFFSPPSAERLRITHYLELIGQLEKMLGQVRNQQHAYQQLPPPQQHKAILDAHQTTENQLDAQIKELQEELEGLCANDEDLLQSRKLMTTVKGIGNQTANIIIAKTNGVTRFQSAKKLAKFAGIAPTEKSSGSSVRGRRGINRSGNATLRKALYCATWSAVKYNKACKELYQRLKAAGKPPKLALIAVANLLIRQIYAVVTSQKPFDNDYRPKNIQTA